MINKNTGYISLNEEIQLVPNSEFASIEKLKLGETQKVRDLGNGYKWLDIKNLLFDNHHFTFQLCFLNEKLTRITMVFQNTPFDLNPSWDSWSEEHEKERLTEYQNWLTKELGKIRNFDWGEVWAAYDPKGGFSSIGISYSKN